MYYEKIDHERQEITLTLRQQDVDDLAYACSMGEHIARGNGDGEHSHLDRDLLLAGRLNLMLATFMVAFEALKVPADNGGGEGVTCDSHTA